MVFTKRFPRNVKGSAYPQWEEIFLSKAEEARAEQRAKEDNHALMIECLKQAQQIADEQGLKPFQSDIVNIAIALFEKQASHTVYWKEDVAKEKFHRLFPEK